MPKSQSVSSFSHLKDTYGRGISYLRLSVTDRCNFRCLYCAPQVEGMEYLPHSDILSYEEFLRLVRLAVSFGVKKVRLTGGEPFVRAGLMDFIRKLRNEFPDLILGITTNATNIRQHIRELKELELDSLNISLDTLQPETFKHITGVDLFHEVRAAIDEAIDAGLTLKVNAVGLKGINSHELPDFLRFAKENPIDFRIIEYMPLGGRGRWTDENFWPAVQILEEACTYEELTPTSRPAKSTSSSQLPAKRPNMPGPARLYDINGGKGRFGIITPVSEHFCAACNRLRITSDGKLRTCLFSDIEHDLRSIVRDPLKTDADIYSIIEEANRTKPLGTELLQARKRRDAVIERKMSSIGG